MYSVINRNSDASALHNIKIKATYLSGIRKLRAVLSYAKYPNNPQ